MSHGDDWSRRAFLVASGATLAWACMPLGGDDAGRADAARDASAGDASEGIEDLGGSDSRGTGFALRDWAVGPDGLAVIIGWASPDGRHVLNLQPRDKRATFTSIDGRRELSFDELALGADFDRVRQRLGPQVAHELQESLRVFS